MSAFDELLRPLSRLLSRLRTPAEVSVRHVPAAALGTIEVVSVASFRPESRGMDPAMSAATADAVRRRAVAALLAKGYGVLDAPSRETHRQRGGRDVPGSRNALSGRHGQ